jgi:hypothetical protein
MIDHLKSSTKTVLDSVELVWWRAEGATASDWPHRPVFTTVPGKTIQYINVYQLHYRTKRLYT